MKKLFENKWIRKIVEAVQQLSAMQIGMYASQACFFLVLSVFPALVLLLSLLRYTGLEVSYFTDMLGGVLPDALMPYAKRLILSTYQNTTGTMVSLSVITALWSAGRGMYGLLTGLNAVYRVKENRGYLYTRCISVFYTFAFLLVLLLTLILHVFGTSLMRLLEMWDTPVLDFLSGIVDLRFFLLLFTQTVLFSAMFIVLPNRKTRISDSIPGALLASIGWLVFSNLYSVYVERFATMSNVYGSVYAVALSMLWLYCCVSIVFYGGALNRYLEEK